MMIDIQGRQSDTSTAVAYHLTTEDNIKLR